MTHRAGFIGRMGPPQGAWYKASRYKAQATDGTVVYPTWIFDGTSQRYAKSSSPTGSVSQVAFSGLLENFTRASDATYFDASGTLRTAATNEPRFTYDPATLQPLGLLVEESRTNLVVNSENFSTGWTFLSGNTKYLASTAFAPDGGEDAYKIALNDTSNSGKAVLQSISVTAGNVYTSSIFAKRGEYSVVQILFGGSLFGTTSYANFDLLNGTLGTVGAGATAQIIDVGNGWYRCITTVTASNTGSTNSFGFALVSSSTSARLEPFSGTVDSGIYVWGAQMEQGATATSYIPTAGSTVTRAQDEVYTNEMSWFNASEGTFVVKYNIAGAGDHGSAILGFGNSSSANRGTLFNNLSSMNVGLFMHGEVTTATAQTSGGAKFNVLASCAGVYLATSSRSFVINGGTIAANSVDIGAWNPTRLSLGRRYGVSAEYANGTIATVLYYPKRLTDSEIQRLTAI